MGKIYSVKRPKLCPVCHKFFMLDKNRRCVHCGAWFGMIKW